MNIKYNKQKHEMRDDPVMDFLLNAKTSILKNVNVLIGVVLVLVFAAGFVVIYSNMRNASLAKAEDEFGRAMIEYNNQNIEKAIEGFRIVADNHRNLPQGATSAFMLGTLFQSMNRYDEAIQWFNAVPVSNKKIGFISGEALEGLAACHEAKGDVPKALEYLAKALKNDQIQYRYPAIKWKMALLYRKTDKNEQAVKLCREMLADTLIGDLRQPVKNLLAALTAANG